MRDSTRTIAARSGGGSMGRSFGSRARLSSMPSRGAGGSAARSSVGPGGTLELPALAAGIPYALTVYRSTVVAGTDGERAYAVLVTSIHMWQPRAGNYTGSDVAGFDTLHPSLALE